MENLAKKMRSFAFRDRNLALRAEKSSQEGRKFCQARGQILPRGRKILSRGRENLGKKKKILLRDRENLA